MKTPTATTLIATTYSGMKWQSAKYVSIQNKSKKKKKKGGREGGGGGVRELI